MHIFCRKVNFTFSEKKKSLLNRQWLNLYHTAVLCNLITASKNETIDNYSVLKVEGTPGMKTLSAFINIASSTKSSLPQRCHL